MTSSRYSQISDELLSAYIDDMVTEDEKALIEAAMIDEPAIAWRLETLRYTVNLLHALPAVALPRSFVLSEAQMANGALHSTLATPTKLPAKPARPAQRASVGTGGFWQSWRDFWLVGNLFLRNAAAASLAIFLVLSVGRFWVANSPLTTPRSALPVERPANGAFLRTATPELATSSQATEARASTSTPLPTLLPTQNQPLSRSQQAPAKSIDTPASTANSNVVDTPVVTLAALAKPQVNSADSPMAKAPGSAPGPAGGAAGATELAPEAAAPDDAGANQRAQSLTESQASTSEVTSAEVATQTDNTPSMGGSAVNSTTVTPPLVSQTSAETVTEPAILLTTPPVMTSTPVTRTQVIASDKATIEPAGERTSRQPSGASAVADLGSRRVLWERLQFSSALITLFFAGLWWRSRMSSRQTVEQ